MARIRSETAVSGAIAAVSALGLAITPFFYKVTERGITPDPMSPENWKLSLIGLGLAIILTASSGYTLLTSSTDS